MIVLRILLVIGGLLWVITACAPGDTRNPPSGDRDSKLNVIVSYTLRPDTEITRVAFLARVRALLDKQSAATMRIFSLLPAFALTTDGATVGKLLSMPEVTSVERDQELKTMTESKGN